MTRILPALALLAVAGAAPAGTPLMIWNDLTKSFEPVLAVPCGAPHRADAAKGRVGFDVRALGVLALAAGKKASLSSSICRLA
jgi:hypothetical protein